MVMDKQNNITLMGIKAGKTNQVGAAWEQLTHTHTVH